MTGPIFDTHAHYSARAFDADRDFLLGSLPDNALVVVDQLVLGFLLAGKTITGHTLEASVIFADINGGHHRPQVLGTELQDIAPQHVQGQAAQHLLRQFGLAVA